VQNFNVKNAQKYISKFRLWKISVQQPVYYVASIQYAHYGGFVNVYTKLLAKHEKMSLFSLKF